MTDQIQVLGISNAIVDVLVHVEDDYLVQLGTPKGSMTLIDADRAAEIYAMMGPATEMSGGSVANTIAGIANLGGDGAYIGKVADDQLGQIFVHDMQSLGVDVRLAPAGDGAPTARCYIFITPDGQRTMQTYLGACTELSTADITPESIDKPRLILLEGYIFDTPDGPRLAEEAIRLAERQDTAVALSLSDSECVARHRETFLEAVRDHVDIVIADDTEAISLFESDTFDDTVARAAEFDCLFALTRSEQGSVIVIGPDKIVQQAYPVQKVIDTTGAGDAYAAAFLFGWVSGKSLAECADLGSYVGAAVIQQVGARIERHVFANDPRFQG
jgi:sugar/nucleoside kinase (ribokinase family)